MLDRARQMSTRACTNLARRSTITLPFAVSSHLRDKVILPMLITATTIWLGVCYNRSPLNRSAFAQSASTIPGSGVKDTEVATFRDIKVYLDWNVRGPDDPDVREITRMLCGMNKLLYDITDGQIR